MWQLEQQCSQQAKNLQCSIGHHFGVEQHLRNERSRLEKQWDSYKAHLNDQNRERESSVTQRYLHDVSRLQEHEEWMGEAACMQEQSAALDNLERVQGYYHHLQQHFDNEHVRLEKHWSESRAQHDLQHKEQRDRVMHQHGK